MRDVTPNDELDDPVEFILEIQEYLPPMFRDIAGVLPRSVLEMSLDELEKSVRPSSSERAFKIMFWDNLRRCEQQGIPMTDLQARCGFISTRGLEKFTDHSRHLFWLLTPEVPIDVLNRVKLADIMRNMDVLTKYTSTSPDLPEDINYKYLDYQMKMYAALDKRVHGDFTQKIEEKSLRISHTTNVSGRKVIDDGSSIEDKVKRLQERIERAGTLGGNVVSSSGKEKK